MIKRIIAPLLVSATWLPLLWLLSVAFREDSSFLARSTTLIPREISTEGLTALFERAEYRSAIVNAFLMAAPAAAVATLMAFTVGYRLSSRSKAQDKRLAFSLISFRFLPAAAIVPAIYWFTTTLHAVDTLGALILVNVLPLAGLGVLLLAPPIRSISGGDIHIARLEGASESRVLLQVVLPQVRPFLIVSFVVLFAFAWNEYLFATVLSQTAASQPLSVVVASGIGQYRVKFSMIASAGVISILPSVAAAASLVFQIATIEKNKRLA